MKVRNLTDTTADLHAMRKSLSTMMAVAGMSQRARQAHMRHTDPRLTDVTYMDERLLPIASELSKLPNIPEAVLDEDLAEAIQFRATGTNDYGVRHLAEFAPEVTPEIIPADSPENSSANTRQILGKQDAFQDILSHRMAQHPCGLGPVRAR